MNGVALILTFLFTICLHKKVISLITNPPGFSLINFDTFFHCLASLDHLFLMIYSLAATLCQKEINLSLNLIISPLLMMEG